jgi:hypothetical protein
VTNPFTLSVGRAYRGRSRGALVSTRAFILAAATALSLTLSGCNFDADYSAFCADTGRCDASSEPADAGPSEDAGWTDGGDPTDAGSDAGTSDAGGDGGSDAGPDAGSDAGSLDAGFDAGSGLVGKPFIRVGSKAGSVFPTQCWPLAVRLFEEDGGPFSPDASFSVVVDLASTSTGSAPVVIYADSACGGVTPWDPFTQATRALGVKVGAPGQVTFTATAPGFDAGVLTQTVETTSLVITSFEQTIPLNGATCSAPVEVRLRDSTGTLVPFPATTPLSVSVALPQIIYNNPGCALTTPGTIVADAGAGVANFFVYSNTRGTFTVSVDAGALGATSQVMHAGEPYLTLALPGTLAPAACSATPMKLGLITDAGVTTARAVLSATPATCASFSEQSNCAGNLPSGAAYQATTAGASLWLLAGSTPGVCQIDAVANDVGGPSPATATFVIQ